MRPTVLSAPFDPARIDLLAGLRELLAMVLQPPDFTIAFAPLRRMLAALPLARDSYAVALNRLDNAQHYLEGGEGGAAAFELRMLLGSLSESTNN